MFSGTLSGGPNLNKIPLAQKIISNIEYVFGSILGTSNKLKELFNINILSSQGMRRSRGTARQGP
jgi:hypothetical protein